MNTKCSCRKPPGGGTECPPDCLAICRHENGECRGYCRNVPIRLSTTQLYNWVLKVVKEEDRALDQYIDFKDQQILEDKRYVKFGVTGNSIVITFNIPNIQEI